LSKPYSREDLAFKLRQMLGSPGELVAAPAAEPSAESAPAGANRVLVVEDDGATREAVGELIGMLGHQVVGAANAQAALDAMAQGPFDVLLTDINLPDMTGIELARRWIKRFPDVRVIFASGENVMQEDVRDFSWQALRKPYTLEQLESALRDNSGA
jgi:CheY-like chemotaxis protein